MIPIYLQNISARGADIESQVLAISKFIFSWYTETG